MMHRPGMGDKKRHDYPPEPKKPRVYYDEQGRPHNKPPRRERVKRPDGSTWIRYNPTPWDRIKDPIIGDDESLKRDIEVRVEDAITGVRDFIGKLQRKKKK